jgi:homoserine O-succinyltransferase/O-acetyltransferase
MFAAMINDSGKIRVAILDLYEGHANEGMRCIREILNRFSETNNLDLEWHEFDVRRKNEVPDMTYDFFISSGGPGDPLESRYSDWEKVYFTWLKNVERWNNNPANLQKKFIFFICHSFQLACRHYNIGVVCKRKSTAFGTFPIHLLEAGFEEPVFKGLHDPFYAVDSRDFQVIQPNHTVIQKMGAKILCIEKERRHVPYERAIMGIRFNEYMIGTQFHPEADAAGMTMYLQREDKKKTVIENHGEEKWSSMIRNLNDPDKILLTYSQVLPNFLNLAVEHLQGELV